MTVRLDGVAGNECGLDAGMAARCTDRLHLLTRLWRARWAFSPQVEHLLVRTGCLLVKAAGNVSGETRLSGWHVMPLMRSTTPAVPGDWKPA